ncbi:GNAT family N-acetyltransferase [Sphingomonas mesophila]|uniref:GNAT family N-acetyltransferase n=1 Tax=Sphingomonas mesophila TaxID=2303576 RepID=UPI000E58BAE9|nr:GNAT family N-acetyltransferase [Sphingomonas mesophila]
MSVTYRDGVPGDGAAIGTLFRESFVATFGHLYKPEDLAAFIAGAGDAAWEEEVRHPRFRFRLAEDDETLAGFAKLGPDELPGAEPGGAELWALYLREAWHGAGVAAALMEWTIDAARSGGAPALRLTVFIDNHRARRFYERYGFVEVGKYAFKVGNHVDDDRILRLAL